MDKSWMTKPRNSREYEQGVQRFIDFALAHKSANGRIICPCSSCGFKKWKTSDEAYEHLIFTPFPKGYKDWHLHGEHSATETTGSSNRPSTSVLPEVQEPVVEVDSMRNMIEEAFGVDMNHGIDVPLATNKEIQGERAVPKVTHEGLEAKEEVGTVLRGAYSYERLRQMRIEENNARMEALGFPKIKDQGRTEIASDEKQKKLQKFLHVHSQGPNTLLKMTSPAAGNSKQFSARQQNPPSQQISHAHSSQSKSTPIPNRLKHELEIEHKRKFSRTEVFPIFHKEKNGSYVNDEAREKSEQLAMLEREGASSLDAPTHDAFAIVFGKEHPSRVRGMGFGVQKSHLPKASSSHCGGSISSASRRQDSEKIEQLKTATAELRAQMNYLITHIFGDKVPPDFPSTGNNEIEDLESSTQAKPSSSASSSASHAPTLEGPSKTI